MNYLIDGHNLIGSMPNISLSDDNDEFKLVFLLRKIAVSKKNRQILVVFDRGVYGTNKISMAMASPVILPYHPRMLIPRLFAVSKAYATPKSGHL